MRLRPTMVPPATAIQRTVFPEFVLELGGMGATVGCGPGVGTEGPEVAGGSVGSPSVGGSC